MYKRWSLRYSPGQCNPQLCVMVLYVEEGSKREECHLLSFQLVPLLPTSKLGPSGADSQVGGFVYVLEPCESLQRTLLWGWEFLLLPPQLSQVFSVRGFEALFSHTGALDCVVFSLPSQSSQFICTQMWDRPLCNPLDFSPWPSSQLLATSTLQSGCSSPPLLLIWMNISL